MWMIGKCLMCVCQADGEDELKKMQLMELAIMNGTYRDALPPQAGTTFIVNTPRNTTHTLYEYPPPHPGGVLVMVLDLQLRAIHTSNMVKQQVERLLSACFLLLGHVAGVDGALGVTGSTPGHSAVR